MSDPITQHTTNNMKQAFLSANLEAVYKRLSYTKPRAAKEVGELMGGKKFAASGPLAQLRKLGLASSEMKGGRLQWIKYPKSTPLNPPQGKARVRKSEKQAQVKAKEPVTVELLLARIQKHADHIKELTTMLDAALEASAQATRTEMVRSFAIHLEEQK